MPRPSCLLISILVIVLLALFYSTTYLVLTLQGQYEFVEMDKAVFVNRHEWAPRGFFLRGEWNGWVKLCFWPLYRLDTDHWHPPSAEKEKFVPMPLPVVVQPEDVTPGEP